MMKLALLLSLLTLVYSQNINELLCLTNAARRQNGLPPLALDERLNRAAQSHSVYQNSVKQMTHTGAGGSSVGTRVTQAGVPWSMVAENVAWGYETEQSVFQGWMDSPGHRANILSSGANAVGFGKDGTYWTQKFARATDQNPNNIPQINCGATSNPVSNPIPPANLIAPIPSTPANNNPIPPANLTVPTPSNPIPAIPAIPQIPDIPSIPAVPQTPGIPSIPAVPQTPGIPSIPAVPATPVNRQIRRASRRARRRNPGLIVTG